MFQAEKTPVGMLPDGAARCHCERRFPSLGQAFQFLVERGSTIHA